MIILVPIACLIVGWLLYPVLFPERPEAQPTDLERHHAHREAERQAAVACWKGRAAVIHPRMCSELDERAPLT